MLFRSQGFTKLLDSFGTYLSIGTFGFSLAAWLSLRRQNTRIQHVIAQTQPLGDYQEVFDQWEDLKTTQPYALAISLVGNQLSIRRDVEQYLKASSTSVKDILEIKMDGIKSPRLDTNQFLEHLRQTRMQLSEKGCTDLRVFYQGPTILAIQIGAMFDHWIPVRLYHKSNPVTPKIYEYWGVLTK